MGLLDDVHDEKILEQLDFVRIAEQIEGDSEWRVIKKLADRAVELAIREFALNVRVSKDMDINAFFYKIIELQNIIKTYKYGIFDELKQLQTHGKIIFNEAQERGLTGPD